ncbi:MAG TPA: hypothetical protein VFE46_12920 [Pirellulales bacterium]|jgi:hypothetical protein|nr:hypothetical protein [Pirellulales bacterium]
MDAITITGQVNEQHVLSARAPDSIPPGPVTILVLSAGQPDDSEQAWMAGIANQWSAELSDPRQDIYTLDDGAPVNAA